MTHFQKVACIPRAMTAMVGEGGIYLGIPGYCTASVTVAERVTQESAACRLLRPRRASH